MLLNVAINFLSPLSQGINGFLEARNCQQKIKCISRATSLKAMKSPEDGGWSLALGKEE